MDILSTLNPAQYEAVTSADGPLIIFAGAGTGKTRVITSRIAYLVGQKNVNPKNILAITFTNKAAEEMRERVNTLLPDSARDIWISTFHRICLYILRNHADEAGFTKDFVIYDDADQMALIKECIQELEMSEDSLKPRAVQARISIAKSNLVSAEDYIHNYNFDAVTDRHIEHVYKLYSKKLRENNAVDFDDIIFHAVKILKSSDRILKLYQNRFKHVLVDEYQDINFSQYVFVKTLSQLYKNICVVGDDDQCVCAGARVLTATGNAPIESLADGVQVASCSGRDTFAAATADKITQKAYSGKIVRITLENGKTLSVTPNHLVFARYNTTLALNYVYLMFRKGFGFRLGACQGLSIFTESQKYDLEEGDRIWIVKICRTPKDAWYYENFYSSKYGIPTMHFSSRANSVVVEQEKIGAFYGEIDTFIRAELLMKDFYLFEEHPHFVSVARARNAMSPKVLSVVMFGSSERASGNGWYQHRMNLDINARNVGMVRARNAVSASRTAASDRWMVEATREDYSDIVHFAKKVSGIEELMLVEKAQLTAKAPFYQMPASHVHEHMILPYFNQKRSAIEEMAVTSVEYADYEGFVYDLSVPNLHNYMVDGFIVHNSIYSWRGADVRSILNFEKDYPGARIVKLEQNYRSTKNILLAASEVIKNNMNRREKTLWTTGAKGEKITVYEALNEQAEVIFAINQMRQVIYREDKKYSDFAFFYRTNAQSRVIEETLIKEGIPYKMVGAIRFYQRKEIKDILAYLKLILNTSDNLSLKRILNVPRRGIGEKSINSLISFAEQKKVSIFEALSRVTEIEDLPLKAKNTTLNFVDLINELRADAKKCNVTDLTRNVLEKTGYLRELKVINSSQTVDRSKNVNELLSVTAAFDSEPLNAGLPGFLERVSLISDLDEVDERENAVTLMTFHSAKGLEFPVVFMLGMEEKLFPHEHSSDESYDIAEERRLCYVGMTRARERLYLVHTRQRRIFGSVFTNPVSRFINEIPDPLVMNISCEEEFLNSIPQISRQKPVGDSWGAERQDFSDSGFAADGFEGTKDLGVQQAAPVRTKSPFARITKGVSGKPAVAAVQARAAAAQSARAERAEPERTGGEECAEFGGVTFGQGDRVKHSMWGIGVVIEAAGRGDECLVKVNFMNVGEKKLLLKYAPLDKI